MTPTFNNPFFDPEYFRKELEKHLPHDDYLIWGEKDPDFTDGKNHTLIYGSVNGALHSFFDVEDEFPVANVRLWKTVFGGNGNDSGTTYRQRIKFTKGITLDSGLHIPWSAKTILTGVIFDSDNFGTEGIQREDQVYGFLNTKFEKELPHNVLARPEVAARVHYMKARPLR